MLRIISGSAIEEQCELMEDIWRFRHRHFVDRFGWEDIRKSDGREIDQFDTSSAIHLVLMLDCTVVGYTRLLPTTKPHLLSDVYPCLMGGRDWPRGNLIYEWTRCVAEDCDIKINSVEISHLLMTGVMEFCLAAGILSLIVETHPKIVAWLAHTGWNVRYLAGPSLIDSKPVLVIEAMPSGAGLLRHRKLHRIRQRVIDLDGFARDQSLVILQ